MLAPILSLIDTRELHASGGPPNNVNSVKISDIPRNGFLLLKTPCEIYVRYRRADNTVIKSIRVKPGTVRVPRIDEADHIYLEGVGGACYNIIGEIWAYRIADLPVPGGK